MDAWTLAEDHARRSDHVRSLLADPPVDQGASGARTQRAAHTESPNIVRFWHDPNGPPPDVAECLDSWRQAASAAGAELLLFDDDRARSFIAEHYGKTTSRAYDTCPHPAMRADLFRLCWLVACGGVYVDADDALVGQLPNGFLASSQLQLQPLCYDQETNAMVPQRVFLHASPAESAHWTFYANNAPIAAPPDHPVLIAALERALGHIELAASSDGSWDIQATTGPGNLTAALVVQSVELARMGNRLALRWLDWDAVAVSRYPLSYRDDARNWRRWNGTERVCEPSATTP
jgi:mannosyltransferase OCH1-like enzyme